MIRLIEPPASFAVGSAAECRWKGGDRYFPGRIAAIDGDRIHIVYDDGDDEWTSKELIRFVQS